MRQNVLLPVLAAAILGCAATPASASTLLGSWSLGEGAGQTVADGSGHGATGQLGDTAGVDPADPTWTTGHDGLPALSFSGTTYVSIPASPELEPAAIAVDAWVRRVGSPGQWRYIVSKGAIACDRSSYGLYSGFGGGLAFYVSDAATYRISPEAPAEVVWDGAWHHVTGVYDGKSVTLAVDGRPVGDGTAASIAIAYSGQGLFIGTYRGSCDLPFSGDIEDVSIWDGPPSAAATGPAIAATPGTPTKVAVGKDGTATGAGSPGSASGGGGAGKKATSCMSVRLSTKAVRVRQRSRIVATVLRAKRAVARASVRITGGGTKASARTDRRGRARLSVRAKRRGTLTVRVAGQRKGCGVATLRVR
ncbi:MAG: hypothetical protein QOG70_1036 [Solirubrobacteraceae bacterium]|jgi:hypothetical protein|nr:hypothetical protein [Solirubrobacteraceae bacterium]